MDMCSVRPGARPQTLAWGTALFAGALRLAGAGVADLFEAPITPARYHHPEYETRGYSPAYCPGGFPSFDLQGRPYMFVQYPFGYGEPAQSTVPGHHQHLMFLRDGEWRFVDLLAVLRRHFGDDGVLSGYSKQPEFVHDTDEMFVLVQYRRPDERYVLALVTSPDHCRTFSVHTVEQGYSERYDRIATEHYAGHNRITWPLVIATSRRGDEPEERFVDHPGSLWYHVVGKQDGRVGLLEKGMLSESASRHPIGSFYVTTQIVSTPRNTHIAWHETSVGVQKGGNRTFVRSYDRRTGRWGAKTFVGPSRDDHGFPAVTLDSKGFLHILCGAHASQVRYARSSSPDDSSRFEPLESIAGVSKGTHLSLVCDARDRLHLFFLDHIRMGPDQDRLGLGYVVRDGTWQRPRRVANSPEPKYCRMCNHLSIDKRGRLFLNYAYFTLNYRSEGKVTGWYYPVLAYSKDHGATWDLVPDDFGLDE